MRLTTVAQVCSTVAGLTTWNSVSGSPSILQSHISPSSGPYTLPMHEVSMVSPCIVSVVTTADMPMHTPAGIVSPIVSEYTSTSLK